MRPFFRLLEICAFILILTAAIGAAQDYPLTRDDPVIRDAVGYLLSCQNDDGGFGNEPDAETGSIVPTANAAMALALTSDLNRANGGGNTPLGYLVANPPGDDATGGNLGRYVMGIIAAGGDPRDVSGIDYVGRLKDFAKPPYGEETLFSESYILLGLAAAGESDSAVAQAFVSYVKDKQHSSGGWGWGGGAPDLDTTGIAVCAVLAAGEDPESQMVKDAVAYIRTQQSDDGGFASSGMSADTNAISDYWAIMALNAAGVDPTEWRKGSETPVSHLLSCQQESGVFWWKPDTQGGAGFLVEATAYGIIALMGERLPTTAAAFSALETDWLSWTDDASVKATKFGEVDENDPRIVTYTLTVQNLDESTKVATVADVLPEGMRFLDSSVEPSSVEGNTVTWTLIDIGPYEAERIVYRAEALRSGRFLNRAVVNAWSVDGSSPPPVYANAIVEIGDFEGEVEPSLPIWHPPDWDFEYMDYGNNLTCEEIVNLKAPEVASK